MEPPEEAPQGAWFRLTTAVVWQGALKRGPGPGLSFEVHGETELVQSGALGAKPLSVNGSVEPHGFAQWPHRAKQLGIDVVRAWWCRWTHPEGLIRGEGISLGPSRRCIWSPTWRYRCGWWPVLFKRVRDVCWQVFFVLATETCDILQGHALKFSPDLNNESTAVRVVRRSNLLDCEVTSVFTLLVLIHESILDGELTDRGTEAADVEEPESTGDGADGQLAGDGDHVRSP